MKTLNLTDQLQQTVVSNTLSTSKNDLSFDLSLVGSVIPTFEQKDNFNFII